MLERDAEFILEYRPLRPGEVLRLQRRRAALLAERLGRVPRRALIDGSVARLEFRVSAVERGRTIVHAPCNERDAALRLGQAVADTIGSPVHVLCTTDPRLVPERVVAKLSPRVL